MRSSLLLLAPAFALLAATTGCVHGAREARAVTNFAVATTELVESAQDLAETSQNPEQEWTEADDTAPVEPESVNTAPRPIPPHLPASAADRRVDTRAPFDLGGAYGSLARVDLSACKAQGLAAGYGRVVLAFDPDGTAAGVGVELPAGSSPAARACVEQAFGAARVSPFDGAPMNVRRTFFVKG
jgi:hypothetical protein